jgi:hypothetical protein
MTIPVVPIILHILPFIVLFVMFYALYRYILHPDFRWYQRGNICYDKAYKFSAWTSAMAYILILLVYYDVIDCKLT